MPDSILEIKGKSGKIYQFRIPEGIDDAGFQRIQQTAERVMISNGENAFSPLGPPAPAHLPSQAPASPPAATPKTVRKEGLGYMPVGDALKQSIYGKPPPRTAPSLEKARIQPPPKLPTLREQLAQAVEAAKKHQRIADEMAKRNRPTIGPATPQMMQQPRYSGEELDKQMLAAMSYEQLQAEYDRRRAAHEANPKNTQQFEDFRTAQEALAEKSPGSLIKPAYLLQDILTTAKSAFTREEEEGIGRLAAVAQTAFNIGMLDEPVAKVGSKYVGGVIAKMATKGPLAPIVKAMKAFAARGDWSAIGREISRMNPGEFETLQGAFRDAMPDVTPSKPLYRAVGPSGETPENWVYTTESHAYAKKFAGIREGSVETVSASLKKPIDISNLSSTASPTALKKAFAAHGIELPKMGPGEPFWQLQQPEVRAAILAQAKDKGYDGIIFKDFVISPEGKRTPGTTHVFFDKPNPSEIPNTSSPKTGAAAIKADAKKAVASSKGEQNKPPVDQKEVAPRYHQERVTTDDTLAEDLAASLEAAKAEKGGAKEPWQMTREEFEKPLAPVRGKRVFYRGEGEGTGTGSRMSVEGKGLYLTANKAEAAKHGNVRTYGEAALPRKPLEVRSQEAFDNWVLLRMEERGYKSRRLLVADYPDVGEFVKTFGYDGVKIGKGADAVYVNYDAPFHRKHVLDAIKEGKPVPPEVLADYPDLAKQVVKPNADVKPKPPAGSADVPKASASEKPPTGSGVSRATRAQMAEVLGTRGPTSISGKTLDELYKQGQKDVVTGQPEALIAELAQKGQPASDKQFGLFAAFRDHLVEHLRGLNEALANPISEAAHAASLVEREDLLARIAEFDRHLDEVKASNGRGLGAIRIGQTVNWGDLGEATIEARRFAGTTFKPGVEEKLAKATSEVQRLEEALKRAQSAAESARAEEGFARAASGPRRGARTASVARADRKASGERIKELIRKSTNVGPSAAGGALQGLLENAPELAREIRRYIELAIEEFKLTRLDQQFYDTVRRELGSLLLKDADGNAIDFSDADIRQIFAKHYEQTTRTPREAAQTLSNLRKQADLFEKIEQAKAGVVPERGPRPPAASEEVKALRSQLNQLLKTISADPGADAARTRLQGILADVDAMLKGQYRKVKAPKGEVAPDIAALKQRIADVRTQMRLQDRLSDLEEQIRTGQLRPPTKRERQLSDAAARIQSQVDSAKQRVRAIAEAQRPQSVVSKVEGFGRNMQLLNQMARVIDATANTVKLASYIATNPVRSTASALMFGKTTGRETFLLMPEKVGRIMKGAPERWGREIAEVWRGADLDTLNKFGKTGGLGTKLAGVTDVVFKDFYTRAAMDDYALGFGREAGLRGQALKDYRLAAWKQLTTGGAGPLSDAQVRVAAAGAEDWALRQTFNIENVLSEGVAGAKQNVRRFLTKRGKPDAADGLAAVIDMTTRFTKVITNVALEKANYTNGLGAVEALIRLGNAKRAGGGIIKGKVATQDARLIVDLATKGLTGLAVYKAGTTLHDGGFFDDLKERGILSMEVMQTEGGTRFVQWRIAPDLLGGGLDADQLGGVLTPLLMGATKKELERQVKRNQLTEKQAESLFTKYRLEQAASTPLASGMKDAIRVAEGEKTIQQFIASYVSRQLVPGGVRDIAERWDEYHTGVQLRKSKEPQDEFIKRIPIWRQSLPSNMKGAKAGATNAPPMPDWMKGR